MAVRDFPPRPQGAEPDSVPFQNWLDALGNRQSIDLQQELTSVASGDEIGIFDVSETGQVKFKKITRANFLAGQINALLDISGASGGQIKFPATQNASSDANTLDDYEEGTFTLSLSFTTPGNLSIAYASREGYYTKIGRVVETSWEMQTSSFTHTTASGASRVSGWPFTTKATTNPVALSALDWQGITKVNYTQVVMLIFQNDTVAQLTADGSGQAASGVSAADMPSGGSVILRGSTNYVT